MDDRLCDMDRRKFLAFLAAGGVVMAEGLWMPGQKLISIPQARGKFRWVMERQNYDRDLAICGEYTNADGLIIRQAMRIPEYRDNDVRLPFAKKKLVDWFHNRNLALRETEHVLTTA